MLIFFSVLEFAETEVYHLFGNVFVQKGKPRFNQNGYIYVL